MQRIMYALSASAVGLVLVAAFLVYPQFASAQPCGATAHYIGMRRAIAWNPSVCTTAQVTMSSPVGDASSCQVTPSYLGLRANWLSTAVRTMDPTGGCIFKCSAGAKQCKVDRDGLPVELLSFGVE